MKTYINLFFFAFALQSFILFIIKFISMSDESSAFSVSDSRLPEPIAFRRIDSIQCREEDSILVDEDSKEHHVVSVSLPYTP